GWRLILASRRHDWGRWASVIDSFFPLQAKKKNPRWRKYGPQPPPPPSAGPTSATPSKRHSGSRNPPHHAPVALARKPGRNSTKTANGSHVLGTTTCGGNRSGVVKRKNHCTMQNHTCSSSTPTRGN